MSDNFSYAIERTLKHEGGFVDNPSDPGGATNYGISLRWLRKQGPLIGDFDGDGDVDAQDIKNIGRGDVMGLYRQFFWSDHFDRLLPAVAYRVFDHKVNAGPRAAARVAQRACRAGGFTVKEDGVFGPRTAEVLGYLGETAVPVLRAERAGFYRALVEKNPRFRVFLKGWLNRAYS